LSSSDPTTEKQATARRAQIRVRVDKLRRSRQLNSLGVPEIVALAASALLLLALVIVYITIYRPATSRVTTAQQERARLQQKLSAIQEEFKVRGSTQDAVTQISQSLEKFESDRLSERNEGRVILYNTLIQLMRNNNLRNTAGPVYNYLDAIGTNAATGAPVTRNASTRWQSLYPGIAVTVTVEGQYPNLRRFVRDIESSNQFIIINAVELEKATETEGATVSGSSAARSSLVSLRLDMAAYYRRETGEATEEVPTETR
jgi:Tfp pilus assembly protein PilO